MDEIPTVTLDRLTLIDAHYQYELICDNDNARPSGCLLLFGCESGNNLITIERCMNVPLKLNYVDDFNATFEYDSSQVDTRISLLYVTNPQLKPLGIMVFNDKFYDYTKMVEKLKAEKKDIKCLFAYEPQAGNCEKHKLYCYMMEGKQREIKFMRIDFQLQNINIALGKGSTEAKSTETVTDEEEFADEKEKITKLITKLDRIIKYLESLPNNDSKILRNVSMLVMQLKRQPTEDIEEEIMNKESEINALNIACEQWEIGTSRYFEDSI